MDEVRRLRKLKGLTQVELAELAGVSAYTVTEIETGHREPRPSTLRKLADALDADVADFFPKVPSRSSTEPPKSGDEGRRALYLMRDLEAVRDLANLTQRELGTMVRTFFNEIPDLPPVESVKRATGWSSRISSLKSHVFVEAGRWETRVLGPLSGEDLPEWERELLDQIRADLDKADAGVRKLHLEFGRRWDEAYEQVRRALNQEALTVEQLLESIRVHA